MLLQLIKLFNTDQTVVTRPEQLQVYFYFPVTSLLPRQEAQLSPRDRASAAHYTGG